MKEVLLIDGHSLIYRSFYAFIRNPLRNSKGENTSAVFGFINTLRKLFAKYNPKYSAIVYDTGRETFRHKEFTEYKISRVETPDELKPQIPIIKEIASAYGLSSFEIEGYEADDVLASLANILSKKNYKVYIVTSDKDLMQMVTETIQVYDPWKDVVFDSARVKERFGVDPKKVADILALAGDTIDNIPGVPGIGDKRAQEIILKYRSVEKAIEKDERVKLHKNLAILSKNLSVLKSELKIEQAEVKIKIKPKDSDKLFHIFKEMEFSSLMQDLASEGEIKKIKVVELINKKILVNEKEFSFNFDKTEGLFIATNNKKVLKIPQDNKTLIKEVLEDDKILKIGFDIKAQLHRLNKDSIELAPPIYDLKIASWLLDPSRRYDAFNDLLVLNLGIVTKEPKPIELAAHSFAIYKKLAPELTARDLDPIFEDVEMPLIEVLADMEHRGVKIDFKFFTKFNNELKSELHIIEKDIYKQAGVDFNINSPKQLSQVLFEKLRLPTKKRTKTGFSTDSSTLQELQGSHPIVPNVLRYRELAKLISTYLEPMLEICVPKTHRIHTSFNQTGTATGRLSSSNPNLQNIPMRGELGKRIRQGFIARDGYSLISADYSQIELRVLAHISGDEALIKAFQKGEDIHTKTACAILNCKEDKVNEEGRRIAKVVNYGLIYGLSDYGLASNLGIPLEDAQSFIDEYLSSYPKVAKWREDVIDEAKESGLVKTILGRIRPLPGLFSNNRIVYEATKRVAINAPIQGSAADIMKKAMLLIFQRLKQEGFEGGMIIQIHDELVFEIEDRRVKQAVELIKTIMKNPLDKKLDVPLEVSIGIGKNWASAH
jgi:DNA polymerase-1